MQPQMFALGEGPQILDHIVEGIFIDVMHVVPGGDGTIMLRPHGPRMHSPPAHDTDRIAVIPYLEAGRNPVVIFVSAAGIADFASRLGAVRTTRNTPLGVTNLRSVLRITDLATSVSLPTRFNCVAHVSSTHTPESFSHRPESDIER